MNRDSESPTSMRCRACGSDAEGGRPLRRLKRTYQVVVACATCGTSFVALSRN